jgi:NTP pyrophosphatase (non-canonical NTP hydrolase)
MVKQMEGKTTYQERALRTLSQKVATHTVSAKRWESFRHILFGISEMADDLKRDIFYGLGTPQPADKMMPPMSTDEAYMYHALLGIISELGELYDSVLMRDKVNTIEELGDLEWYLALARNAVGTTQDEVQEANIRKLMERFPDKFNEKDVVNRDLDAERGAIGMYIIP